MSRLAAIIAADAVDYSLLAGADEAAILAVLDEWRDATGSLIEDHNGRIFGTAYDSVLAEFASAVAAVHCAIDIQDRWKEFNEGFCETERIKFRIVVQFGDIVLEGDNILGAGVNVAAMLEDLAQAGGVSAAGHSTTTLSQMHTTRQFWANLLKPVAPEADGLNWRRTLHQSPVGGDVSQDISKGVLRHTASNWPELVAGCFALIFIAIFPTFRTALDVDGGKGLTVAGPRIAVMSFEQDRNDTDPAYFGDGLPKDINGRLWSFTNLSVVLPNPVRSFRDEASCRDIRNAMKADLTFGGGLQHYRDRMRTTTTLTDAEKCSRLREPKPFELVYWPWPVISTFSWR